MLDQHGRKAVAAIGHGTHPPRRSHRRSSRHSANVTMPSGRSTRRADRGRRDRPQIAARSPFRGTADPNVLEILRRYGAVGVGTEAHKETQPAASGDRGALVRAPAGRATGASGLLRPMPVRIRPAVGTDRSAARPPSGSRCFPLTLISAVACPFGADPTAYPRNRRNPPRRCGILKERR